MHSSGCWKTVLAMKISLDWQKLTIHSPNSFFASQAIQFNYFLLISFGILVSNYKQHILFACSVNFKLGLTI